MIASEPISASLENYLEVIFHIVSEKAAAKPRDIARKMGVNSSSVTGALRALAERGMVNYAPFDLVTLTPKGRKMAKNVAQRHKTLHDFFVTILGVDEAEAEAVACEMEHAISPGVFERFVRFLGFLADSPQGSATWVDGFGFAQGDSKKSVSERRQTARPAKKRKK
jgi:DtxR family Mn-dependent transcriptional regulator